MRNDEYFYQLNRQRQSFEICHITFTDDCPSGFVRLVFRATYGKNGLFTFKGAKRFSKRLVKYFNTKKFRKGREY